MERIPTDDPRRGAPLSKGTIEQKERWVPDILSLKKIGAWAITEPGSGSDAFSGMRASARREGDEFVLNGSKTFITNAPFADTTIYHLQARGGRCRLARPQDPELRSEPRDAGLRAGRSTPQDGPALVAYRLLFLNDVPAGMDRLLGGEKALAGGGERGNGYMSEYVVEQPARDSKVLQIYAGTDEIQIRAIAMDLLKG